MTELEKLTINLSPVDIGQIELLVQQGFYANRAEFIRIAIRDQLQRHAETVREAATREAFVVGALAYSRQSLEKVQAVGERLAIRVIGLLTIAKDVSPELARAAIASVEVLGIFRASPAVKEALADRTS